MQNSSGQDRSDPYGNQRSIIYCFQSWKRLHWCRSKVTSAFQIASLMAMFAVIAAAELPLPAEEPTNPTLLIVYVSTTSLLVATTVIVKVVSVSILPHLDSIAEMSVNEAVLAPHDAIINWILCTCILGHTVAPVLFCLDLILIAWIKFPRVAKDAPLAVTAIMAPMIGIILAFGLVLYRQMNQFKVEECYSHSDRRYSEIADTWDEDSCSLSQSFDEEAQLIKSQCSITSYGAVKQNEYIGPPNTIFADFWH